MPLTTPMPKDTAKIFCQKKYSSRHTGSRVRSQRHSRNASRLDSPMVNAGNSTWNAMTNPNWIRDNSKASMESPPGKWGNRSAAVQIDRRDSLRWPIATSYATAS